MFISPIAKATTLLVKAVKGNLQRELKIASREGGEAIKDTFENIMSKNVFSGEAALTKTHGIGIIKAHYIRLKAHLAGLFIEVPKGIYEGIKKLFNKIRGHESIQRISDRVREGVDQVRTSVQQGMKDAAEGGTGAAGS